MKKTKMNAVQATLMRMRVDRALSHGTKQAFVLDNIIKQVEVAYDCVPRLFHKNITMERF